MSASRVHSDSIMATIRQVMDDHRSFLILGHNDLDGDCLGCQLALHHHLTARGKDVTVVSDGPTLDNYDFLPGFGFVLRKAPPDLAAEATIVVDCAVADRLIKDLPLQGLTINIDHHIGNTDWADVNWVEPHAAAVGEMIFTLLDGDRAPLAPEIAACLYIAIMTDTGSFRYTYTSARTFEIAAQLVRAGAHPFELANRFYNNVHPETACMAGEVLSNLHFELGGALVWGELKREVYERLGGLARQPEQLASQMRAIKGVEVAVLFHEYNGSGRASFRSRGHVSVGEIAAEVGGGGHFSAAGCRFTGTYEPNRDEILSVARRHILEALAKRPSAI